MATKTETQINEFKINYLTEEQYQEALANNQINDDEIYMTPKNSSVTYSLSKSGNTITLTGSDGSKSSVTYNEATTSSSGLMSASDKVKLNTIDTEVFDNAGSHNCVYRGKSLGTSVTTAQYAEISAGTFKDMYIGDYWTINGVVYRIAAFDYYLGIGQNSSIKCASHHVTIVPDKSLYSYSMNSGDTTTGAYYGSKMYTEGLNSAKTTINSAFGSSHVLTHTIFLPSETSNNYVSGGRYVDNTVKLMNERNVFGCIVYGNVANGTNVPLYDDDDAMQYPLFRFRPDLAIIGENYWLRDVVDGSRFVRVFAYGGVTTGSASAEYGVRPTFSIC